MENPIRTILRFPRRFWRRLKVFRSYYPILMEDEDWDHCYFFILMRHKLKRMEVAIRNGMSVNSEKDADRIHLCVLLLNRIIEDDHFSNAQEPLKRLYGEDWLWDNDLFKKDEEHQNRFRAVWKHSEYMLRQDVDYLFKILAKYVQRWWE